MYETIVWHCVSICQKRVGDGCFFSVDVLLAAR